MTCLKVSGPPFTYKNGSDNPLIWGLDQKESVSGRLLDPPDLSGIVMQMRIPGLDLVMTGTSDGGWVSFSPPSELPVGTYETELWATWPDGFAQHIAENNIVVS